MLEGIRLAEGPEQSDIQRGLEEAVEAYRSGVDRGDPGAAVSLGRVLQQLDRPEEAVEAYRSGIDRGDPEAAVSLGRVLQQLDRPEEAAEARAVELRSAASDRPAVFISYRRKETAAHAGRLYSDLTRAIGEERVFMDLEMAAGLDFVEEIEEALESSRVLLAVLGPGWASIEDEDGQRRLHDPEDLVRLEIEGALKRPNVRVVPILLQGATMPKRSDLPDVLAPLLRRQAAELSDTRWNYDFARLMDRSIQPVLDLSD